MTTDTLTTTASKPAGWAPRVKTGRLVLADGAIFEGFGFGATGTALGEVCFNTAMTGYQEILTDPSYANQFITFTFPHIGNVGANSEDQEQLPQGEEFAGARGLIIKANITEPSNWRATQHLNTWLKARGIIGLCGIDTRALTAHIREHGMPNAALAYAPDGVFNLQQLRTDSAAWPGLLDQDLVPDVGIAENICWTETSWAFSEGFGSASETVHHVVAIDFGVKRNILRLLADRNCKITVVPATTSAEDILALNPDGIFLSNGPGDPAATGTYAVATIQKLIGANLPIFGICLGHQILALALGATTKKMHQGHHGANHPVMDYTTGKVEVTSMNHGFAVDGDTLPDTVEATHTSLFDGSNCGLRHKSLPIFSVQHHPEASPGPRDSHYLFDRFINHMKAR
ncbi:MAG: glutamine-hydrolyzing carbamoyl-phosphate synthase small subunit [Hyphomicrobiales bacterium]|jgi:carbamoyl-phosphate synthase small subunit